MERLYVIVQHKGVCDHNGEGLRDGPREVLHTSECTCHSSNKNTFLGGGGTLPPLRIKGYMTLHGCFSLDYQWTMKDL